MRDMFLTAAILTLLTQVVFSHDTVSETADRTAPSSSSASDADRNAIRVQSGAFVAAFNRHDAKAVAALWTEDGEYIDDTGHRFAGREEIEQGYADLFSGNPIAKIEITVESIRILSGVTAIEDGSAVNVPVSGVSGVSHYTAVHAKVDGQWLMASVRERWVEAPIADRSAADLQWLIGTWIAEEYGVQTESTCRWVAGERFMERRYTTTQLDGTKSSGVQLIGWNPLEGHVQSWDFSPDGGHAVGIWSPTDGGWQADVHGTTGDGTPTAAVNVLKRLDDNAYVWQSIQRSLGETPIPDTGEIVIRRRSER
ncbi:MAG: nuclear transport factor 2 family protein [Fuerstiella sp.]